MTGRTCSQNIVDRNNLERRLCTSLRNGCVRFLRNTMATTRKCFPQFVTNLAGPFSKRTSRPNFFTDQRTTTEPLERPEAWEFHQTPTPASSWLRCRGYAQTLIFLAPPFSSPRRLRLSSLGLACVPHTMVTKTSNIPIGLDHKKGRLDHDYKRQHSKPYK